MSPSRADIIATYLTQFSGRPPSAATGSEVMHFTMEEADRIGVDDIGDAQRAIELVAERYGLLVDDWVNAINTIRFATACDTGEAIFQLERVVKTVEALEGRQ